MSTRNSVLIVDDDLGLRKTLFDILKAKGYAPMVAATGREALEKAAEEAPRVAMIDLRLEGMSGLEVMRELKELSPGIECIVVTGYASQASAIDAINLGAYSYVQKPYDPEQLLLTIRRAMEKQEAAEALSESEKRFRDVLDNSRDIAYKLNIKTGSYDYVSPSVLQLYGFSPEQTIAMGFEGVHSRLHPEDKHKLKTQFDNLLRRTERLDIAPIMEYRWRHKDGEYRWFSDSRTLILDGEGHPLAIVGSIRDITQRKQAEEEKRELEEKLERARRMESLGVLAGGVAHDLNNLLGPLVAYPDLILMELPEGSACREDVVRMREAAERSAAVVQDLLTLARRGVYRMSPLNLNAVIEQYLCSPSHVELVSANPNVMVDVHLDSGLLNITGSVPHLSKVIMNLVTNAFESMPHGGYLAISTSCESLDRPLAGYEHIDPGDYVVLRVGDAGVGIEDKDLGRIFEPFYTKKEMGRSGSGLGLAVVYGVLQDHKGKIDIKTEVGRGTEFIIYFPVTRETSAEVVENTDDYCGNETVLVIDDLEEQRVLASKLLTRLGYTVQTADSGQMAIQYLGKNDVDILVLDMIMDDGLDGLDIYREIVKSFPDHKAIIASGFAETERVKEAQKLGAGPFVKKPYTLENIGRAVRRELDRV